MEALIELINVSSYTDEGTPVFEDARLRLVSGERALITAPVASGKSVLMRLLAGLERPEKGVVFLFGQDTSALGENELNALRKKMGFVFQDCILISNLKVIENVALPIIYHAGLSTDEALEKAAELLELVGFRGDIWGLPGGLPVYARKEAAVARALALEPDIVVCENILEFLTDDEKAHISELLLSYHMKKEGRLMVFTSTNEADARFMKPHRTIKIEGSQFRE